jgi:hypothetical protein
MATKKFTVHARIDYNVLTEVKKKCVQLHTTPSAFLRSLVENSVHGKNICSMEEVYKDYGEMANIFYDRNNIYIMGNIPIDDEIITDRIDNYINNSKYDVVNVLYAKDVDIINIEKVRNKAKNK